MWCVVINTYCRLNSLEFIVVKNIICYEFGAFKSYHTNSKKLPLPHNNI